MSAESLKTLLSHSIERETDLLRDYTIAAERIHDDDELKDRLRNFAEGNAKRSKQLTDELKKLK
ncbi:hypothetical protein FE782_20700 [Paenibacillus antri]|uniref:Uncharacterized protein n=2 Tax=Paenibacillus antri TaxID=2582848 RepID=A0A5R9GGF1_9BACL|nr:hypothetical protein FE782_20700 [Paenibacillus antri]